ncbi:MAG: SapC family protein [Caulobacteraceae bacterium]
MTDATQVQQPPLSGNLMFYTQPEPLNKVVHAKLGLKKVDEPYSFVADTHVAPLLVNEFGPGALTYPIIFAGSPRRPIAVMAINEKDNLFCNAKTGFEPDAYVPLYVRRYPFALANDHANQKAVLVVDRAANLVSEDPDMPFFEKGEPTKIIEDSLNFCNDFEMSRQLTDRFCDEVEELDLFEVRTSEFTPNNPDGTPGEPQKIAEYFAVSEEKLNALSPEDLTKLRNSGALHQIYAHLVSLGNWDKLLALHFTRLQTQSGAANQA